MDGTPIIQAVVVIYKRRLMECESIRLLSEVQKSNPGLFGSLRLLIQDNSPVSQPVPEELVAQGQYRHCPGNPGLADAYNYGMASAKESGAKWLLLLDQDAQVTSAYLEAVSGAISAGPPGNICAFVPKLFMGDRLLSPHRVRATSIELVSSNYFGLSQEMLWPFNSGAVISLSALASVGGFDWEFPLDCLDNLMFTRLFRAGFLTSVLDISLQHSLALFDMEREMSPLRYKQMLAAQWRLYGEIRAGMSPSRHRARLLLRGIKQYLLFRNKQYSIASFAAAFSRIPKHTAQRSG
jgi:glycosyltransferase involved in cell wall biosynthesis